MRNLILSVLLLASAFQTALGAVTYYFNGNLAGAIGTVASGTPFSGYFDYEFPQSLNPNPQSNPQVPSVRGDYIPTSISVTIGSEKITFTNLGLSKYINIYNKTPATIVNGFSKGGFPSDDFHVYLQGGGSLGGMIVDQLQLYMGDGSGSVFSDLNLVGDSMRLSQFGTGYFYIRYYSNTQPYDEIRSDLTSLVPEPSSLSLLAFGGLVAALRRMRY